MNLTTKLGYLLTWLFSVLLTAVPLQSATTVLSGILNDSERGLGGWGPGLGLFQLTVANDTLTYSVSIPSAQAPALNAAMLGINLSDNVIPLIFSTSEQSIGVGSDFFRVFVPLSYRIPDGTTLDPINIRNYFCYEDCELTFGVTTYRGSTSVSSEQLATIANSGFGVSFTTTRQPLMGLTYPSIYEVQIPEPSSFACILTAGLLINRRRRGLPKY
jgi:hypothetical protein